MYDAFNLDQSHESGRTWYLNCARQLGKSYFCCVLALEECLRGPGRQVKYASVDQKSARAIVFPQMEMLLRDAPEELRPQFRAQDGVYYFPHNGSRITVAGGDRENRARLRGQQAHLAIVDEGAFVDDLDDLVLSVLMPQTITTRGRIIIATTPPTSSGHPAYRFAMECKTKGAYAKFTIWDSLRLKDEEKHAICREYGGEESSQWQREYLAEFRTETTNAVVPEFNEKAHNEIVRETVRPIHFHAIVSLDGGFVDNAGVLFAHVDFLNAKVVIEDEWVAKGALTDDVASAIMEREQRLWGETDLFWTDTRRSREHSRSRIIQVMDVDPRLTAEFKYRHGMDWKTAQKRDLQANVNLLNQYVRQRSLVINPRCQALVRQLHNVTWSGRPAADGSVRKNTFSRNREDSHFDLVAALLYLLPEVDLSANPIPPPRHDVNMYYTEDESGLDESEDALANAFRQPSGDDS